MDQNIILNNNPRMEFKLSENGFELIDGQTTKNSGVYSYSNLKSIQLNKVWYPYVVKWLRYISWLMNGAPLAGETTKKANLKIILDDRILHIWLTDLKMTNKAKTLKTMLTKKKPRHNN